MLDIHERLLSKHGWQTECNSPFEIRHQDGSFASEQAADAVLRELEAIEDAEEEEKKGMFEKTMKMKFAEYNKLFIGTQKWEFARDWLKEHHTQIYYNLIDAGCEKGPF